MNEQRGIPSVDSLLHLDAMSPLVEVYGRNQVVESVREVLEEIRTQLRSEKIEILDKAIVERVRILLEESVGPSLVKVINATGVILHTNLGRAPLCADAMRAAEEVAAGYASLEFDLGTGERGSRSIHAQKLLRQLTGAEDALVVNNNAAAVLLCLSAIASRRKVVISRGQLVEIGGGFRVPDVMKQSGAKLVEVGTTNRVRLGDYEAALKEGVSAVMRAHSSNFKMIGFVEEPALADLVALTHQYNLPFIDDLGSGALLDTSEYGIAKEPMVQDSVKAGADLVCFSGDKLLGGPQAGIIVGRKELIEKVKHHSLARAVRADKLCLAALSATLLHYLKGDASQAIPVWHMISMPVEAIRKRALHWKDAIGSGEVEESTSTIGGGSLPGEVLPTCVYSIKTPNVKDFVGQLRKCSPPLVGRIQDGKAMFDPRTVFENEDQLVIMHIKSKLVRSKQ